MHARIVMEMEYVHTGKSNLYAKNVTVVESVHIRKDEPNVKNAVGLFFVLMADPSIVARTVMVHPFVLTVK